MYRKEFVYDRETRDYAMYLDGELVGFARTYHEAEITLDQLVFELISGSFFAPRIDQPEAEPAAVYARPAEPAPDVIAHTAQCFVCGAYGDGPGDGVARCPTGCSYICDGLQFPCGALATETIETASPGRAIDGALVSLPPMRLCAACAAEWRSWQEDAIYARPAEPAAELIEVLPADTKPSHSPLPEIAPSAPDASDVGRQYPCPCLAATARPDFPDESTAATTAAPDPIATAIADDPALSAAPAGPDSPRGGQAAPDLLAAALAADPNASTTDPTLTRASEYDLPLPADAWHCGVCHQIFWTDVGAQPLACPRCEHQAQNPPLPLVTTCSACGGAHLLAHCEELAREWRTQAQAEIRAGAAVGAHITRDLDGFLREYTALTKEQRAGVVRSYCAWQRAECRPAVVAKRWARMAEEVEALAEEDPDAGNDGDPDADYAAMRAFSGAMNMSDMESDHI